MRSTILASLIIGTLSCAHSIRPKNPPDDAPIVETKIECPYEICENQKLSQVRLVEYYPDGKIAATMYCENGKSEGRYQAWYQNGQPSWDAYSAEGKTDGLLQAWYLSGIKMWHIEYVHGKYDGVLHGWHENGEPYLEQKYDDGYPIGTHREYDLAGEIIREFTHKKKPAPYRGYGWGVY